MPAAEICDLTKIDPWFIHQIEEIVQANRRAASVTVETASKDLLREVKRVGTSDEHLAQIWKTTPAVVRLQRARYGVSPVFKRVDTCAAEFESFTPYMYSTYEEEDESEPTQKQKIMILGSGPNRIGQGIEFDYCCCHASFALREDGYETIMVNCNPETVSTDYDTSDRLYFEPLTLEDVLAIVEKEKPSGVIVQFGGQTPLNLALELKRNGVPIIGTTPESIDLAEDRRRFGRLLEELQIPQPRNGTALVPEEAARVAGEIGLPVLVRPSYVLGGRAMVIAYDVNTVQEYVAQAALMGPARPVLIDQFLEEATEVDVDALADGTDVVIGGIMEHIEEAGVHSGDSSCVLPPVSLSPTILNTIRDYTKRLALALKVVGLMNVQYAIQRDTVYVLEVNPRASRTVPYVSKATGVPLAKVAARLMVGRRLADMKLPLVYHNGVSEIAVHEFYSVKSPVFPFNKFRGVDTILGPEMRSTGEVMGISTSYGQAFAKAQLAAGQRLPQSGTVFHQRQRSRQAPPGADRQRAHLHGLSNCWHTRHRCGSARGWRAMRGGFQSERRPAQHRRPGQNRKDRSDHQHAARPRILLRRKIDSPRRHSLQHSLHHHTVCGACSGARYSRADRDGARSELPAGLASKPSGRVGQHEIGRLADEHRRNFPCVSHAV